MEIKHYIIAVACTLSTTSAFGDIKPRGFEYSPYHHARSAVSNNDHTRMTVGKKSTAPLQSFGSPKVPVVLVQFPDMPFSVAEGDNAVNEFYDRSPMAVCAFPMDSL